MHTSLSICTLISNPRVSDGCSSRMTISSSPMGAETIVRSSSMATILQPILGDSSRRSMLRRRTSNRTTAISLNRWPKSRDFVVRTYCTSRLSRAQDAIWEVQCQSADVSPRYLHSVALPWPAIHLILQAGLPPETPILPSPLYSSARAHLFSPSPLKTHGPLMEVD